MKKPCCNDSVSLLGDERNVPSLPEGGNLPSIPEGVYWVNFALLPLSTKDHNEINQFKLSIADRLKLEGWDLNYK